MSISSLLTQRTNIVKSIAADLGFTAVGISKATFLNEEAPRLEKWLATNKHGKMHYMENYFDKRLDPRLLVDGAKSVVSLMYNYYTTQKQHTDSLKISKYAFGEDYHIVVKDLLHEFISRIQTNIGEVQGRVFVDSAPVLEKAWAVKSGLGWVGKNSNIIRKGSGSYFFLAELILDLDLQYDSPATDHCGSCTACMDACPTDAIVEPYQVDGSKCISYFTIELKEQIPEYMKGKFDNWIFGCDVCQDVCPWNRFALPHQQAKFEVKQELLNMHKNDWKEITHEVFNHLFKNSAVNRAKYNGLKRNIDFVLNDESVEPVN
jgi:epoxyqueuosine reductase